MELKIIKEKESPLLSRKEITANVAFSNATPSEKEVRKLLAGQLKADEKLVVVKKISGQFGNRKAKALAFYYMSEEEMKRIEPQKKESKDTKKAESGEEKKETPAEKAKEEKKAPEKEAKEGPKKEAKEE